MDADDRSHLVEAALNSSSIQSTPPTPAANLDRISATSSGIGRSIESDIMGGETNGEASGNAAPSKEVLPQVKRPIFTPPDGGCWVSQ